jgi:hypothetical protein
VTCRVKVRLKVTARLECRMMRCAWLVTKRLVTCCRASISVLNLDSQSFSGGTSPDELITRSQSFSQ